MRFVSRPSPTWDCLCLCQHEYTHLPQQICLHKSINLATRVLTQGLAWEPITARISDDLHVCLTNQALHCEELRSALMQVP